MILGSHRWENIEDDDDDDDDDDDYDDDTDDYGATIIPVVIMRI